MSIEYIKKTSRSEEILDPLLSQRVREMLGEIRDSGEEAVKRYSNQLDSWEGDIIVTRDSILLASERLPQKVKDDICFAHDNITRFAEAQKNTISEFSLEITPGFEVGQKNIPVSSAGCYVPGGRYSHIASALMTVTTARVAGVRNIIACSPPKPAVGISDEVLFALDLCGANTILNLGGVQGIAAMAYGLFGVPKADILVGPGNQYVAEAKRQLFGQIGIDMFAGPTDSLVIADSTADPLFVATDLIGQAEHDNLAQCILISKDKKIIEKIKLEITKQLKKIPRILVAKKSLTNNGMIIHVTSNKKIAEIINLIAPEHLELNVTNYKSLLPQIKNAGSICMGKYAVMAMTDYNIGSNHILPTNSSAKYSSGISVNEFYKRISYINLSKKGIESLGPSVITLANYEGLVAHAKSVQKRIRRK